jgi:hypothetical protein
MSNKKKYIIGLGCSWTQGEGGYPDEIWKEYNGRVQIRCAPDYHLRKYEHENSWVNVLCRDYFTDHTPMNLGARGIGNRAAVHQLHFCDKIDWKNSTGIIVLMMSGMERFDFFQENPKHRNGEDDGYSNGEYVHYKWRTAWPFADSGGAEEPVWAVYGKFLWSEQFQAAEQMMALLDVQTFAKAHGYKLVVANGFNFPNGNGVREYLKEYAGSLSRKFDWNQYVHDTTDYMCFVQKLVELDGELKGHEWHGYFQHYHKKDWPTKYLTNCEGAHPTLEGYKVIGAELAKFIKLRGYA